MNPAKPLYRSCASDFRAWGCSPQVTIAQAIFQAICHYLHEHAEQAPGRVEIAEALGLHAGHVSRLITRFADCFLSALRHRGQLEHAQRLLRGSEGEFAGIARAAGFSSSTHFIRVFKAAFACTPGQWRRRPQAEGSAVRSPS